MTRPLATTRQARHAVARASETAAPTRESHVPGEGAAEALASPTQTVVVLPDRPAVLLPLEARARGFKSALSFKRWCRRYGVPVLHTEKLLWVKPSDVDAALARVAQPTVAANDLADLAAASVARSIGGRR